MINLTIDGRNIQAEEGQVILDAAREAGIDIPTLCHNESLPAYGACRLCMVEVSKKGRKKLVASCLYQAEEGLEVATGTERVLAVRKLVLDLLLARCPDSEVVREMAREQGVTETSFEAETDGNNCVLCGLCTRACQDVVGASAISLVNRGVNRQVATPFFALADTCIACGSCSYVCPTGAITVSDQGDTRVIAMPHVTMEFKLAKCASCGRYFAPQKQLDFMMKEAGLPADHFDKCLDCRD